MINSARTLINWKRVTHEIPQTNILSNKKTLKVLHWLTIATTTLSDMFTSKDWKLLLN